MIDKKQLMTYIVAFLIVNVIILLLKEFVIDEIKKPKENAV